MIEVGEIRKLGYTCLSLGEGQDPKNVKVEVDGPGLRIIPAKPPLNPQRRNIERLSAYFEIQGVKETDSVILKVLHENELFKPIYREFQVVSPQDKFSNFPYGVFFEKQAYTIHNNGTRTISFIARGRKFRNVDWTLRNLIESSNQDAVPILGGNEIKVEMLEKDIWKGDFKVRGLGIGKKSTISVKIPIQEGLETSSTRAEVVEKDIDKGVSIKIRLVQEDGGKWRATWDRSSPNVLKIYAEHPTLKRYLGEGPEYKGQELPHFRILLAEIVAEKVVQRILEAKVEAHPQILEDADRFFFLHSEEMTEFLPKAHKIMLSDTDAKKISG